MNQDFVDLLRSFVAHSVRFLVVGAYALAVHGRPRATGDFDVWVDATPENAPRVMRALAGFGAPMQGLTDADFAQPGIVYQMGLPPGRIDVITELTGLTFAAVWPDRVEQQLEDMRVPVIGREAFIRNKKATGRSKDLVDVEDLE
jgi:hypothetical protein